MTDFDDPRTYDEGYFASLPPDDQDRFIEDFKDNLDEFDTASIERSLRTKFDRNNEHLNLLKAIGACFHAKEGAATGSGFPLYGVNPLCGTKQTETDAILVNKEHSCVYIQLIFCEIGGENPGEWIENINYAHRLMEQPETKDILRERLGVGERDIEIGYSTLTREDDAVGLDYSALNSRCDPSPYAIWECDTADGWIRLVDGEFLHPDLEAEFSSEIDYSRRKEPVNFGVGTHPIFPLKILIYKIIKQNELFGVEHIDEFDRGKFREILNDELKVFSRKDKEPEIIDKEVERLLTAGTRARILTDDSTELEEGDYKVVYSGARGPDHARDAVKSRYFKYMSQYAVGEKAYDKTVDEFNESSHLGDYI